MSFLNDVSSVLLYRMDSNNLQSGLGLDSKRTVQDHFKVPRSTMVRQSLLFWVTMPLGGMLFPFFTPRAGLEYYEFNWPHPPFPRASDQKLNDNREIKKKQSVKTSDLP